jgi:Thiamine pyrophosphate enzyme, C-terminal TPP binding domain
LPVCRGGRFVVALGMGGMGYSFGAGIGMCVARTKNHGSQRTVIVAGDGSFYRVRSWHAIAGAGAPRVRGYVDGGVRVSLGNRQSSRAVLATIAGSDDADAV